MRSAGTGCSSPGIPDENVSFFGLSADGSNCSADRNGTVEGGVAGIGADDLPSYIRTTATVVCAVVLALGTAGNLLVPLVVCRTKELRNSTNFFLINLSVADLLVLAVCMPTVLIELHSPPEVWVLGSGMCKAVPFVELAVAHGSILTILAISFERYYAICKPLEAGYTCTKMRAMAIIMGVWLIAVAATCPMLGIAEYTYAEHNVEKTMVPVCLTLANTVWQKTYFFFIMIVFFWLPLLVLIVVYCIIARHLMMHKKMLNSSMENAQMRARRQVVVMLAAVIVSFFVCLLPFRIFTTWVLIVPQERIHELGMEPYYVILYFCRVMLYINSAVNPVLYNVISSKFREAFVRLLCCQRRNRLTRQGTFNTTSSSITLLSSLRKRFAPENTCYQATCATPKTGYCSESFV